MASRLRRLLDIMFVAVLMSVLSNSTIEVHAQVSQTVIQLKFVWFDGGYSTLQLTNTSNRTIDFTLVREGIDYGGYTSYVSLDNGTLQSGQSLTFRNERIIVHDGTYFISFVISNNVDERPELLGYPASLAA